MPENEDDDDVESVHLPFSLLTTMFYMASEAQDHLADALNGKPAELLRHMAIQLDEMEARFMSLGFVDQNDRLLGQADQYSMVAQTFECFQQPRHGPRSFEVTATIKDDVICVTRKPLTTDH